MNSSEEKEKMVKDSIFNDIIEDNQSVVARRNRDCLACRLVSGSGLIGAGIYVAHHSKKFNRKTGKYIMFSVAAVTAGLGVARILALPPFDNAFRPSSTS